MKDVSSQNDFKNAAKKSKNKFKQHRNYTNKEVVQNMDLMAEVAKNKEQKDAILDIKDRYLEQKQRNTVNRVVRTHNYQQGVNVGLHQRDSLERHEQREEQREQIMRNKTIKDGKTYYHQNYSVSKEFNKPDGLRKNKNREMNKGDR